MDLTPFDSNCRALLETAPPSHSRNSFRSAFNHLELAEKLRLIDPIMAAFRVLTAEEEAASGLMYCLKEMGYESADLLKPKNHAWKNAVIPFINMLGMFFAESFGGDDGVRPKLHLQEDDEGTKLALMFPIFVNGKETWAYPIPPLNFNVTTETKRVSYKRQLDAFLSEKGAKDVVSYVKEQANARNRLLYAGVNGYPHAVEVPEDFYNQRCGRVITLLRAFLLIYPYREKQTFVQHSLDAFLAMLGSLKEHDLHDQL